VRPKLEVADIFRRHGDGFRVVQGNRLSLDQRKVMAAIEACRTPALGAHVERSEDCGETRISYNSCLMGKSGNGELARRHRHFSVNYGVLCLHNGAVLRLRRLGH